MAVAKFQKKQINTPFCFMSLSNNYSHLTSIALHHIILTVGIFSSNRILLHTESGTFTLEGQIASKFIRFTCHATNKIVYIMTVYLGYMCKELRSN